MKRVSQQSSSYRFIGRYLVAQDVDNSMKKLEYEVVYKDGIVYSSNNAFNVRVLRTDEGYFVSIAHQVGEGTMHWVLDEDSQQPFRTIITATSRAKDLLSQYTRKVREVPVS